MERIQEWANEKLKSDFGIDDDTFADYIVGICEDEDLDVDEKTDAVSSFLSESTNKDPTELISEIISKISKIKDAEREKAEQDRLVKIELAKAMEKTTLRAEIPSESAQKKKELTKEEKKKRELLLNQYGFDGEEVVENESGESEILYKGRNDKSKSEPIYEGNQNLSIAKENERLRREILNAENAKEKQRIKEMQEKQRLDKEKEKRRTQKREKTRM
ncbi:hypothetical protein HK098_001228 [Nowakowskiella sp. JEL0407]|nr:hypothetical protein HK098_001228 [Nowakowskiella sp. JEL0407]